MVAALLLALQVTGPGHLTGVGLTVTITSPTSATTYNAGTATTLTLSGTAQSDRTINVCTWVNSLGGSGTATGLNTWTITSAALTVGSNVFTVTCVNTEGTSSNDVITVTASAASSGQSQFVTCTTTTANLTNATIQSAINAAADGAVICLPSGTGTAGALNFSATKGVTLAGQAAISGSVGTTTLSGNGVIGLPGTAVTSTKVFRITGIAFTNGNQAPSFIWFYGTGSPTLSNIRIDHNTFGLIGSGLSSPGVMFMGDNGSCNQMYGLVDHNTITSVNSGKIYEGFTSGTCTPTTGHRGTAQNLIFEDNTITIGTMDNPGHGCIDNQGGTSWVWRHNTTTNCLVTSHGVTHGWGPVNLEIYTNTFIENASSDASFRDGYRFFHHQGSGELLTYDNIFTPFSGSGDTGMISIMHYGASSTRAEGTAVCTGSTGVDGNRTPLATYRGYPCKRQPGRDTAAVLQPMYSWLNRRSDTGVKIALTCEDHPSDPNPPLTCTHHVVANRDYYNAISKDAQTSATSPFNGTTGMGFGTLAFRPTTCTTGTEAADAGNGGVGYWATDTSTLYRCSATNTWTTHYTPYTYPAPWP